MKNQGNTCYLASVIHLLRCVDSIRSHAWSPRHSLYHVLQDYICSEVILDSFTSLHTIPVMLSLSNLPGTPGDAHECLLSWLQSLSTEYPTLMYEFKQQEQDSWFAGTMYESGAVDIDRTFPLDTHYILIQCYTPTELPMTLIGEQYLLRGIIFHMDNNHYVAVIVEDTLYYYYNDEIERVYTDWLDCWNELNIIHSHIIPVVSLYSKG